MPLLPCVKKAEKDQEELKPVWVKIAQTEKIVTKSDIYVLGHPEIRMPAVVSSSTVKGIKARLVTTSSKTREVSAPPTGVSESDIEVIKDWEFTQDNQTMPIYFSSPLHMEKTFWIEMLNPTDKDSVVNALIHGVILSKAV